MKCPACGLGLEKRSEGDLELEVCAGGCGGVWFDRDELLKIDEQHEFAGSAILELAKSKGAVKVDRGRIKDCPKCSGEPLVRQFLDVKYEVEMDQCWKCGGIWLDVGEINQLRAQYKDMAERSAAVNAYVDGKLAETKAALKEDTRQQLDSHSEELSNPFRRLIYGFKKLLALDDPFDGL